MRGGIEISRSHTNPVCPCVGLLARPPTCMQKAARCEMSATAAGGASVSHLVERLQAGCSACQLPGWQSSG